MGKSLTLPSLCRSLKRSAPIDLTSDDESAPTSVSECNGIYYSEPVSEASNKNRFRRCVFTAYAYDPNDEWTKSAFWDLYTEEIKYAEAAQHDDEKNDTPSFSEFLFRMLFDSCNDPWFTRDFRFLRFQRERCPKTGRLHIQGYGVYKANNGLSFTRWLELFQSLAGSPPAVFQCRGTDQQCFDYCGKSDRGGSGDPVDYGTRLTHPGTRESDDWEDIYAMSKIGNFDAIDAKVRFNRFTTIVAINSKFGLRPAPLSNVCGLWIYGSSGIGKSWESQERFKDSAGSPLPFYLKQATKWWDGYNGEPVVILDDLDPHNAHQHGLNYFLKIWADRYPFRAESKGSSTSLRPLHFVVTSQYSIEECFPADQATIQALQRRFTVENPLVSYLQRRDTDPL